MKNIKKIILFYALLFNLFTPNKNLYSMLNKKLPKMQLLTNLKFFITYKDKSAYKNKKLFIAVCITSIVSVTILKCNFKFNIIKSALFNKILGLTKNCSLICSAVLIVDFINEFIKFNTKANKDILDNFQNEAQKAQKAKEEEEEEEEEENLKQQKQQQQVSNESLLALQEKINAEENIQMPTIKFKNNLKINQTNYYYYFKNTNNLKNFKENIAEIKNSNDENIIYSKNNTNLIYFKNQDNTIILELEKSKENKKNNKDYIIKNFISINNQEITEKELKFFTEATYSLYSDPEDSLINIYVDKNLQQKYPNIFNNITIYK